jgi:3-phenylpropionate/trans-cinnamate dioxygenase ferredoxin component
MARVKVLGLGELPPEALTLVSMNGDQVVLYRKRDEVFALGNECPHQGGSLCDGWVEGEIVVCPLHGWEFDVRSGACMTVPGERVERYTVSVEGDAIYLEDAE